MPVPKPRDSEAQDDFIGRCMANSTMNEEYPENDQRAAVCHQAWRDRDKAEADMEICRKSFTGIELKKDKPGVFTARLATLNVIDKDGDVTLAGAFPNGKAILISAYQHGSWSGGLPVGKGTIREQGEDVFVDGEFNLNTETGKEHYETVKFAPDLQEWSYGFKILAIDEESEWNQNPKVWRVLKSLDVFEASPVLRGAGVNTVTTAIKNDKDQGTTFVVQAEAALAAVKDLVSRAKSLADLRRKEGRDLSPASREKISDLQKELTDYEAQIKSLLEIMPKPAGEEGKKALLALLKTRFELTEVM